MIRRAPNVSGDILNAANIQLNRENHRVTKDGSEVRLKPKDFAILELLMMYPNKVFSAEAIIERVWSSQSEASAEVVRKHINWLRREIDTPGRPSLIRTVTGVGYSLDIQ